MGQGAGNCCSPDSEKADDKLRPEVAVCIDDPLLEHTNGLETKETCKTPVFDAFQDAPTFPIRENSRSLPQVILPTIPEASIQARRSSRILTHHSGFRLAPEFLVTVPVLNRCLTEDELAELANAMTYVTFKQGETFIKEGDEAKEFFVIVHGIVGVFQSLCGQVATLQDGDVFGESALITDGHRNASLIAETDLVCFSLSREILKTLGLHQRLQFTSRKTVGREGCLAKATSLGTLTSSASAISDMELNVELVSKAFGQNPNLKHLVPSTGCKDCSFAKEVVQSCRRLEAEKGQVIITQGDTDADHFYIIEQGSVSVTIFEHKKRSLIGRSHSHDNAYQLRRVGTLKTGQSFGELALLYRAPRSATVTALEPTSVLSLDRMEFKDILKKATLNRCAENMKYFDGLDLLDYLSAAEKRLAATALDSVHFVKGDVAYQIGDPGATLYVLIDGKVEINHSKDSKKKRKTLEANFNKKVWKYFGQAALISTSRRDSTVTVISATARALVLERDALSILLGGTQAVVTSSVSTDNWLKRIGIVQQLRVLHTCPDDVKEAVARALKKAAYAQGDVVYHKGEAATHFYILVSGCVEMLDGKSCQPVEALMHFGDRELFEGKHSRRSTVTVVSESAHVLRMEMEVFMQLLSTYSDRFSKFWGGHEEIPKTDLVMDGFIARTALGPVEVCTHNATGVKFVLKTMRKDLVVENGLKHSVMRERAAWIQLKCPFVVQLIGLYNEPQSLHFLSEFVPGGSLAEIFHSQCFYGSETHVRFYIAGIVIALRHFHKRHLIHRDVKPENVLVTKSGHPKLYDFALAKPLIGKTFTVCGTPEYMAPEVIAGSGHTRAVDWWSLGIMIYELMAGTTPFMASDAMGVYTKVMEGLGKVVFPPACEGTVGTIVHHLCKQDPDSRLVGAPKVMAHFWFQGFDWQAMASQSLAAPYRPPQDSYGGVDKARVVLRNHDLPATSKYKDDGSGWDKGFASHVSLLGSGSTISFGEEITKLFGTKESFGSNDR